MEKVKVFSIRLPKETWLFLKRISAQQERSMAEIILTCLEKYRKKIEGKPDSKLTEE